MVKAGISLGGYNICMCALDELRNRDEILSSYVAPYACAIVDELIVMDDNAWSHWARFVDEYLKDQGVERVECPAQSPDLNPIEYLWNNLERQVAALSPFSNRQMSWKKRWYVRGGWFLFQFPTTYLTVWKVDAANPLQVGTIL